MPKRAPKGQGMIRKRPDGLWEARINTGYNPVNGKPVRKSVYGKTQQEVRKKFTEIRKEIDTGQYIEPSSITVEKWCATYLENYTMNLKENTRISRESIVRNNINPAIGKLKLSKLKTQTVQSFYNSLINKGEKISTLHTIHATLHAIMAQAVKMQIINKNPCDNCLLPKIPKKKLHTLQSEQIKQFREAIKQKEAGDMLLFILFTGLRREQATGLTWDNVDFKRNIIVVDHQIFLKHKPPKFIPTKNGKTRVLHPAPTVMALLQQQKEKQRLWKEQLGENYQNDLNLVFTNSTGRYIASAYEQYKDAVKSIGLPDIRLHDLRHTYATISIMMGDDIKTVSENLGHASVAFTLDVYGHVTDEMKDRSSKRMQDYINSLGLEGPQKPSESQADTSSDGTPEA